MSALISELRSTVNAHRSTVLAGRKPADDVKYAVRVIAHFMDLMERAADELEGDRGVA